MQNDKLSVTITELQHYYGTKPFREGIYLVLQKEPDNEHDEEAIAVSLPLLGKVGYVANSPRSAESGTLSAGRLYDKIPDACVAVVDCIGEKHLIAKALPGKKLHVKVEVTLDDQEVNLDLSNFKLNGDR